MSTPASEIADLDQPPASVSLMLNFAFADLGLHRIEAATLLHNDPSRKLLHGLGFNEEGRVHSYLRINGKWQDHMLYSMISHDWVESQVPARPARHAVPA